MRNVLKICVLTAALLALGLGVAHARDQIRIVGSSTVFPFSSYVAEEFGATTKNPTPVVESTGSGGGHKLFGAGAGLDTPDITNSSRRMKKGEFETALANGVDSITEAVIGYDGIAIAHNIKNKPLNLTVAQLHLAVAAQVPVGGKLVANPYKMWSDIDASLPKTKITVYGPPTTSGTRDAFVELVMHNAVKKMPEYEAELGKDGKEYNKIREDGVYVPSGENDNLIVQKLDKDPEAIGIFGYSFLEENADRIQGALIDGVKPEPAAISSGKYPISRSLYFYVKNGHYGQVKGLQEYVKLFMDEKMIGDTGLLKKIGLIPLPADQREKARAAVLGKTPLAADQLK